MAQRFVYAALIATVLSAHAASTEIVADPVKPMGASQSAAAPAAAPTSGASAVPSGRRSALPSQALMSEIADWLTETVGLKAARRPPKVTIVPATEALFLRYKAFTAEKQRQVLATYSSGGHGDIAAVYDPRSGAITLVEGWTGRSPAEVSILVHEMVHHFQYEAGMTFACPQESEALAYAAQEKWLERHGLSLASEFNLDPFTVLSMSLCSY